MTKEEALIYISKLREGQMVKIILLSTESKRGDKQLLTEERKMGLRMLQGLKMKKITFI